MQKDEDSADDSALMLIASLVCHHVFQIVKQPFLRVYVDIPERSRQDERACQRRGDNRQVS